MVVGASSKAPQGWAIIAIFFSKNNAYFGQNSYFKAITQQLKAFEKQSKHTKWNK